MGFAVEDELRVLETGTGVLVETVKPTLAEMVGVLAVVVARQVKNGGAPHEEASETLKGIDQSSEISIDEAETEAAARATGINEIDEGFAVLVAG